MEKFWPIPFIPQEVVINPIYSRWNPYEFCSFLIKVWLILLILREILIKVCVSVLFTQSWEGALWERRASRGPAGYLEASCKQSAALHAHWCWRWANLRHSPERFSRNETERQIYNNTVNDWSLSLYSHPLLRPLPGDQTRPVPPLLRLRHVS